MLFRDEYLPHPSKPSDAPFCERKTRFWDECLPHPSEPSHAPSCDRKMRFWEECLPLPSEPSDAPFCERKYDLWDVCCPATPSYERNNDGCFGMVLPHQSGPIFTTLFLLFHPHQWQTRRPQLNRQSVGLTASPRVQIPFNGAQVKISETALSKSAAGVSAVGRSTYARASPRAPYGSPFYLAHSLPKQSTALVTDPSIVGLSL